MKFSDRLNALFLNAVFGAVGSLPLRTLYVISDFVAFLAYNVVGYRRKVVSRNLHNSFPDKSDKELRGIEKGFYRFLGDYFVETLRLGRMSEKEIRHRMRFEGTEEVNRYLLEGKPVSLLLGHYGNWEWISSIPLHMPEGIPGGQIYHPLRNKGADIAFRKIRGRFGAHSIKMRDTLPVIMDWRRSKKSFMIGYIADQVPLVESVHWFGPFLNQDTGAMTGPERLSRMLHAAVFYCDIFRPRRGEYVCRYVKMTDDAACLPQFELTATYYRMLEETILRRPELWLWSHNRWKRGREHFYSVFSPEEAAKRLSHP